MPNDYGAWLSLVERLNGVQEVESSNLSAPTIACRARNLRGKLGRVRPCMVVWRAENLSAPMFPLIDRIVSCEMCIV